MGSLPDTQRSLSPVPRTQTSWRARARRPSGDRDVIWFVPARWLVVVLALARLLLTRGAFAKIGFAGLLWSLAPRTLRIVTAGVLAAATIMVAGSLAAIALLVLQLS